MTVIAGDYMFGSDQGELERLLAQADDLRPEAGWLLDQLGVEEGWHVADVGCGPIGVLDLLSARVGQTGAVVGIEREARFATMAKAQVERRELRNVSINQGDVLGGSGVERARFDLVHERLVLINLPLPAQTALVAEMISLARPGGTIALENWDRASLICYPDHPSWRAMDEVYREAVGDGTTGRTLPWLLRQAGATDVQAKVHVRAVETGDRRRAHRLRVLGSAKTRILAGGRMGEAEFEAHRRALEAHLADPDTLLVDQLLVQAWGKRPA